MNFESILTEVQRQIREKDERGEPPWRDCRKLRCDGASCGQSGSAVYAGGGHKICICIFGEDIKTMTLSNVGLIDLPAGLAKARGAAGINHISYGTQPN